MKALRRFRLMYVGGTSLYDFTSELEVIASLIQVAGASGRLKFEQHQLCSRQ